MRLSPLPLILLTACANPCAGPSTLGDYQAARSAALAEPAPAPADWKPDVVLQPNDTVVVGERFF